MANTISNTCSTALATGILISLFGDNGMTYATIVMSILILVYAEVLPKIIAVTHAEKTALFLAPLFSKFIKVFAPVTKIIDAIARGSLSVLGIKLPSNAGEAYTIEELRGLIEMHSGPDEGTLQEKAMLRSILDLTEVEVGEIMVHRQSVKTIDAKSSPEEVLSMVLGSPHTRFPLWQDNPENVVGVLHTKALLRAIEEKGKDLKSLNILEIASQPWFIPDTTTLLDQLQEFRTRREHFALVVDEYGALMGIVTLEDILEEIVGEIVDEHDVELHGVRLQPNGSYLVAGTVTLRDLQRQFDWHLPDQEAATIAGLVLHETRRIPEVGEIFELHGFQIEIIRRLRNQLTLLNIMPISRRD
jgi:Mg2+/Co2+ transporter CorB